MKTYQAIIRFFEAENVDTIFTLMAEDSMKLLSTIEESWSDNIDVVHARHEQGAVVMADGYSRVSGDVGVAIIGRGPAIAQTGNALVTASKNNSKLLVLVPESPVNSTYDSKSFKQQTYLQSVVSNTLSSRRPETVAPTIKEAFRRTRSGEGPVAVQIPWDLIEGELEDKKLTEYEPAPVNKPGISRAYVEPPADDIEKVIELYLDSDATKPPIILAGRGAVKADAKSAIEKLAEQTSGLLTTTLQARGYFSDHPYYLGFVGSWGYNIANEYANNSDFVIAVGCSLNPHTMDSGSIINDEAVLIHIDSNIGNIGKYTSVDFGIVGDAQITVDKIVERLEEKNIDQSGRFWTDRLQSRIAETSYLDEQEFPVQQDRIDPRDLVQYLDNTLPENRLLLPDGGHFLRYVLDGIMTEPENFVWFADFASIGLGTAGGVGGAIANEENSCVTIAGDAGFIMSLSEVETAARNDVSLLYIVMNDSSLGSEYHNLTTDGMYAEAALIPSPDFGDVAKTLGADGYTVRSIQELADIEDVISSEPDGTIVVDCKINQEVKHRSKL